MGYPTAQDLIESYKLNYSIILKQTEGLDHADSILQPPNRGNCMNWVIGHIIAWRNAALKLLGGEPVWDEMVEALYTTGSEPITLPEQARPFEVLLEELETVQERILTALENIDEETLGQPATMEWGTMSVGKHIAGLLWHETYHIGQLEYLRQLAGRIEPIL